MQFDAVPLSFIYLYCLIPIAYVTPKKNLVAVWLLIKFLIYRTTLVK